jgi:hypothetical protein
VEDFSPNSLFEDFANVKLVAFPIFQEAAGWPSSGPVEQEAAVQ